MSALYNEFEPYATRWLVNLEAAGHIAKGRVDGRSIKELTPRDLDGITQAHFFAGIGAWSYALRLAGWPDDAPIWTGSCPCQPFSGAGKGGGFADERHLWPSWFELIRECRPSIVVGEQVASPDGLRWLDAVRADLEGEGYAIGAADLCAAGVSAPHIRQRLYFGAVRLADSNATGRGIIRGGGILDGERPSLRHNTDGRGKAFWLGAPDDSRPQGHRRPFWLDDATRRTTKERYGAAPGPWGEVEWLQCLDGKSRPTQPGLEPLAHGTPQRVGRLRAYGNAIVPQVAATFLTAFLGSIQ